VLTATDIAPYLAQRVWDFREMSRIVFWAGPRASRRVRIATLVAGFGKFADVIACGVRANANNAFD